MNSPTDRGAVQHEFHCLLGTYALAYGDDGAVWTAGTFGNVNRVDLQMNTVVAADVDGRNFSVTAGAGCGWTTDETKCVLHQIDRAGAVVPTYSTGAGARASVVEFASSGVNRCAARGPSPPPDRG